MTSTTPVRFLFLSHSSLDGAVVIDTVRCLERDGWTVFIAPRDVTPGAYWQRELERKLQECVAVVALVTQASLASEHCQAEWYSAKALKKPMLLCRIGGAALPAPLAELHAVESVDALPRLLTAMALSPQAPRQRRALGRVHEEFVDEDGRLWRGPTLKTDMDERRIGSDLWTSLQMRSLEVGLELSVPRELLCYPWHWLFVENEHAYLTHDIQFILTESRGRPDIRDRSVVRRLATLPLALTLPSQLPEAEALGPLLESFGVGRPMHRFQPESFVWILDLVNRDDADTPTLVELASGAREIDLWCCILRSERSRLKLSAVQDLAIRSTWFIHAPTSMSMEQVHALYRCACRSEDLRAACREAAALHPESPNAWPICYGPRGEP